MKINLLGGFFTKILPFIAMLSACSGNPNQAQYEAMTEATTATADSATMSIVAPVDNAKEVQQTLQGIDTELAEQLSKKKFVYTVSMNAKVKNVEKATTQLWRLARQFDGFVASSDVTTHLIETRLMPLSADSLTKLNTYSVQNQVIMRVPIQHLDTTLLEISKMYRFLENHQIRAEDVTLQLVGNQLKAKLFAKTSQKIDQAVEKKGEKLEEITQAEQQSASHQGQAIHQQINKLDILDKVAFARIEIRFYQESLTDAEVIENPNTDRYEPSFETQFTDSLNIGWKLLQALFIYLAKIWFLIPLGAGAYWAYRKYGR